jgi:hypothetical protein
MLSFIDHRASDAAAAIAWQMEKHAILHGTGIVESIMLGTP